MNREPKVGRSSNNVTENSYNALFILEERSFVPCTLDTSIGGIR